MVNYFAYNTNMPQYFEFNNLYVKDYLHFV